MSGKSSLAQARETAGLTVEQISALTNIRVAVIKDLENNSVDICGGIAYARGHIRTITKVLNQKTPKSISFEADLIVAEIEAAQSEDGRKIIERLAENNVADKPKEKKRIKFKTLASISAAVLSIGFVAQVAINNVSNIDVDTSQITTTRKSFQNEAASTPSGVNLVVTGINGKSWIGLTNANGEQVFNGQISSGQVATFSDPQLIKAVIGNAGAVKLNLNGSDLGVAGAEGEVVRLDFDANGQL
ncbi:MAG: helix-turn-helix domain-containing protein [Actinobacteria bacterium]|nr:helix-turn-helix domain-containing protein [Actinomycetota bacterium]